MMRNFAFISGGAPPRTPPKEGFRHPSSGLQGRQGGKPLGSPEEFCIVPITQRPVRPATTRFAFAPLKQWRGANDRARWAREATSYTLLYETPVSCRRVPAAVIFSRTRRRSDFSPLFERSELWRKIRPTTLMKYGDIADQASFTTTPSSSGIPKGEPLGARGVQRRGCETPPLAGCGAEPRY
jgi:hypothetical protein